jgi:FAD/FMN-containing dehydrogenase
MNNQSITNFGGNNVYRNMEVHEPVDVNSIIDIIKTNQINPTPRPIRAIGSVHSWSKLFNDNEIIISLNSFKKLDINPGMKKVTIGAGVLLGDALVELAKSRLQLTGFPSAINATIGGMIGNSVHNSNNQVFSSNVISFKLIDHNGSLITIDNNTPNNALSALKCNLGFFGIIYEVEMKCEYIYDVIDSLEVIPLLKARPYFNNTLFQNVPGGDLGLSLYYVYDDKLAIYHSKVPDDAKEDIIPYKATSSLIIPFSKITKFVVDIVRTITSAIFQVNRIPYLSYSIRLLQKIEVFIFQLISYIYILLPGSFVAAAASVVSSIFSLHSNTAVHYANIASQNGKTEIDWLTPIRWLESEWSVDRKDTVSALADLRREMINLRSPSYLQQPILVRNVNADDILMSPANGRNSTYISMIWLNDAATFTETEYQKYLQTFQKVMRKYGAAPHWGKLHDIDRNYLKTIHPDTYQPFVDLLNEYDPNKVFNNDMRDNLF